MRPLFNLNEIGSFKNLLGEEKFNKLAIYEEDPRELEPYKHLQGSERFSEFPSIMDKLSSDLCFEYFRLFGGTGI